MQRSPSDTLERFDRAIVEADPAVMAELFTEDGRLLAQFTQPVTGRDAIRRHWAGVFARYDTIAWEVDYLAMEVHSDRAYALATYDETAKAKSGRVVRIKGRSVYFLRLDVDGAWRITVALNSLAAPPEEIA